MNKCVIRDCTLDSESLRLVHHHVDRRASSPDFLEHIFNEVFECASRSVHHLKNLKGISGRTGEVDRRTDEIAGIEGHRGDPHKYDSAITELHLGKLIAINEHLLVLNRLILKFHRGLL